MQQITFCYPNKTISISLTGDNCQRNCSYCEGFYLKSMLTKSQVKKRISLNNVSSCLVSGGCNHNGRVPLKEEWSFIERLKEKNLKLNLHTGQADQNTISKLKKLQAKISFDYTADDKHTELLKKMLDEKLDVTPHILLGKCKGEIKSEYKAIDVLADYFIKEVVFLVFKPAKGTKFEKYSSPEISEAEKIFKYARQKLNDKLLSLGCMRPVKVYREKLDLSALKSGFDKIVMPAGEAYKYALNSGMKINKTYECCVFD